MVAQGELAVVHGVVLGLVVDRPLALVMQVYQWGWGQRLLRCTSNSSSVIKITSRKILANTTISGSQGPERAVGGERGEATGRQRGIWRIRENIEACGGSWPESESYTQFYFPSI